MADSHWEKLHMYHFGTMRYQPTPSVVFQTAKSDLARTRERPAIKHDRERARLDGANPRKVAGNARGTAFLPMHLRDAKCVSDVLRAAIKGIKDGQKSRNVETLTVYQSEPALQAALAIAEAAERDSAALAAAAE